MLQLEQLTEIQVPSLSELLIKRKFVRFGDVFHLGGSSGAMELRNQSM